MLQRFQYRDQTILMVQVDSQDRPAIGTNLGPIYRPLLRLQLKNQSQSLSLSLFFFKLIY